ncbi:MAG: SMP-30/gluconolactonase/LRE family protein [Gemmatimonadales bacterium]
MRWWIPRFLVLAVVALIGYLAFRPVPIEPLPWAGSPNDGFVGPYAENDLLTAADLIPMPGAGPEHVTTGPDGAVYAGLADGRIVRIEPADRTVSVWAETGGRPLGLRFDPAGNLIVADAKRGLLRIDSTRRVTVLADHAGGEPIRFADGVDIAPDGTIWFSDASLRWGVETGGVLDFWESRPTGRLIGYDPRTGVTRVALDSLDFGNGVAIAPGGAWLLINETMSGRIRRFWLAGPRAGQSEIFIEGLPGLPDNLAYDGNGTFWVGLFGPRSRTTTVIRRLPPWLRKVIYRIPERLRVSEAPHHGMVIGLDSLARVRYNLQDPTGRFYTTTGAIPAGGDLYVSTLAGGAVARVRLPEPTP